MAKILLKNIGCLYSGNIKEPVLKANSILIEDGKIVEVGNDLSAADAKVIDAKGTTVMPGLIDSHTHPVVGEWTPRQGSMSWIDPYVRSGVTGLISVGETHIPGKPKNAEGMRALATLAKQTFDNVRPAKMKLYGGAYILHKDAVEADFKKFVDMGTKCTGEIGLGSANTVETVGHMMKWAKDAGLKVTIHRGASYLHGSNSIDPDTIVALQPDVICHVSLGRVPKDEIHRYFDETKSNIEITRPQLGSIDANSEVISYAKKRNELERVIFGNDCPSGFGIYPHGIWELVMFASTFCDISVGTAIALATGNTAVAFNLKDTGTVRAGNWADLVICDAPAGSELKDATAAIADGTLPGISIVMIDGEVVAQGARVNTAPAKNKVCA